MNKTVKRSMLFGCLPFLLLILFIPLLIIFSLAGGESSNNNPWHNNVINAGGHIFAEDYVVLQGFGFTPWATGGGAWLYEGTGVGHTGIDVQPTNFRDFASEDVGVYSVTDGVVQFVGTTGIGGNFVTIQMADGKSAYYGHLKRATVSVGDNINKGDMIGHLGATGATTIYHVHFEVQDNAPNLATQDSSIYLGKYNLKSGDVVRVSDKNDSTINSKGKPCNYGGNNLAGNDNVEKAWNFYKEQGFSDEAIAGILGNFMHESGLQPDVVEIGNGIGYGLAQWSFSRRTDLTNFAKENKLEVSDLHTQLKFSMHEMNNMSWVESYKKIKDVYKATDTFHNEYEKAGIINMASRYKHAEEIYKKYKG